MSKRRGKPPSSPVSSRAAWLLFILGVGVVGGLAGYLHATPHARQMPPHERRAERGDAPARTEPAPGRHGAAPNVQVFAPEYVNGELRYTKTAATPPAGEDPKVFAVNAFLRKAGLTPPGARAVACSIADGIATIEFSREFDQTYGTEDEHTIVDGVLRSLGQFPEVSYVQFSIGGRPMETMGNLDLSRPLSVER
jgi:hypothetical protein